MTELTDRFDFDSWFAVLFEKQTMANIFYLLLSFPLGIATFVLTVTGLSLSVGLAVIGVGFVVLVVLLYALRGVAAFDRQMVGAVLNHPIEAAQPKVGERRGFGRIFDLLSDTYTWRTVLWAVLKFPLGVASFVIVAVGLSIPAGFITAPLFYENSYMYVNGMLIDSFVKALFISAVGVLILPLSLHILNYWTRFVAITTGICLGQERHPGQSDKPPADAPTMQDEIVILKEQEKVKTGIV